MLCCSRSSVSVFFLHFTFFLHIIGTSMTPILQLITTDLSICKFAKTMTERDQPLTTIYISDFFGNSKIFMYNLCTTVFLGSLSFDPRLWAWLLDYSLRLNLFYQTTFYHIYSISKTTFFTSLKLIPLTKLLVSWTICIL